MSFQVETWGPSGSGDYFVVLWGSSPIPTDGWFQIAATFQSSTPVNRIGLRITPSSNWGGILYVDDVVVDLAV